jgi:dihydrofolate synthase/folylpolyglutamate synthase
VNFKEAESYLLSLGNEVSTMKLGLESMRKLLAALGNPQNEYRKVQVAGTNGKGSVCAFIEAICQAIGVENGVTTSPHLVSITERVRVCGRPISESEFAKFARAVRSTSEKLVALCELDAVPTYFEQVTAIALLAFADIKVDVAILETGLGGRLDATTVANAEIAAITRVDFDHQAILGDTLEQIAAEKAAIIRPRTEVCVGKQFPQAMAVIKDRCAEMGVEPATLEDASWEVENEWVDTVSMEHGQYVSFALPEFKYEGVSLSLLGEHQAENAALAVLAVKKLLPSPPLSDNFIIQGLGSAYHPGRLEWINRPGGAVLLDGAHNLGGAEFLARYIRRFHSASNIALVYGSMTDKEHNAVLRKLVPLARDIILTKPTNLRSASPHDMASSEELKTKRERVFVVEDVADALDSASQLVATYPGTAPAFVLVTGSLYLVGEAKKILNN